MSRKVLRMRDVVDRTGIPTSTIYYLIKKNQFPAQIKLSKRAVAWLESDIDSWIENAASKENVAEELET